MSKAPAFQLYARDFLADPLVDAMEPEELGGYFRLLLVAWQQDEPGYLPNDERQLAAWSRLAKRWKKHGPAIMACFRSAPDGRLYQKRMVEVAADQGEYREMQRLKGLAAAAARAKAAAEAARLMALAGTTGPQPEVNRGSTAVQPEGQPEGQPESSRTSTEGSTEGQPKANSASASASESVSTHAGVRECVRERLKVGFASVGIPMPDGHAFLECVRLSTEYAIATDGDGDEVATQAFAAAKKLSSTWSVKGLTPYLFAKHWDRIQQVMAGADPTPVRQGRAPPEPVARKYDDLGVIADRNSLGEAK